jgi:hypothetical protein
MSKFKIRKPRVELVNAFGFALVIDMNEVDYILYKQYVRYDLIIILGFVMFTINLISIKQ